MSLALHITGASGSGATTLGAALAAAHTMRHLDGDDYYWLPSTPPFQAKRPVDQRCAMLKADLRADLRAGHATSEAGVVLSGSVLGWGPEIEDAFSLIVFLRVPTAVRIERLRLRELAQHGRVDPDFLSWAAQYDTGPPEGRSLAKHEAWLATRRCPVLRIEGEQTVAQRVSMVQAALQRL